MLHSAMYCCARAGPSHGYRHRTYDVFGYLLYGICSLYTNSHAYTETKIWTCCLQYFAIWNAIVMTNYDRDSYQFKYDSSGILRITVVCLSDTRILKKVVEMYRKKVLLYHWQSVMNIWQLKSAKLTIIRFYRAMLCIRGTSHGPVSVRPPVCPSVTSRSSTKTAKRRITQGL